MSLQGIFSYQLLPNASFERRVAHFYALKTDFFKEYFLPRAYTDIDKIYILVQNIKLCSKHYVQSHEVKQYFQDVLAKYKTLTTLLRIQHQKEGYISLWEVIKD